MSRGFCEIPVVRQGADNEASERKTMRDVQVHGLREKGFLSLLIVLSVTGMVLVLVSTSRYGVGISPDSVVYISVARNLAAGHGCVFDGGNPYTQCPPLFPMLLAAPGLVGIDPAIGARFLNATAFGAIVFVSGMFFSTCLKSKLLAVVATCAVLLSHGLLSVCAMAWTEPLFVLLIALFTLQMTAFLRHRRRASFVAASLLAALCLLTRYPGVAVIPPGVVLLLAPISDKGIASRIRQTAGFLVISCTPLALYCLRNYRLTGMLTGYPREHSIHTVRENVTDAADVATRWFLGHELPVSVRTIILAALLLLVIGALLLFHTRHMTGARCDCLCVWPAGLVVLTYVPLILYTHQVGVVEEAINDRYLVPIAVPLLWFLFTGIDRLVLLLSRLRGKGVLLQWIPIGLCMLWVVFYPAVRTSRTIRASARHGAGGYSTTGWEESPLVRWLRDRPLEGSIHTNAPDALYALTGVTALVSPRKSSDIREFQDSLSSGRAEYLVWFSGKPRRRLFSLEDLAAELPMEDVATFPDGGVYLLLPASVSPVHCWYARRTGTHSYTVNAEEAANLRRQPDLWIHEGVAFYAYPPGRQPPDARPVHRFFAHNRHTQLFTIDEREKNQLINDHSHLWDYDGIAFYAYSAQSHPPGSRPIHRFWSEALQANFYTISDRQVGKLISDPGHRWAYEGIAWYASADGRQ